MVREEVEMCSNCRRKKKYPKIDECSDKQYLYDNLTPDELLLIEEIIESYNQGKIDLLIPRFDNNEIDFDGEWKLIINESYRTNGYEVLILKWYEGFEDTDYLVDRLD
jgi:hypothetical protein